LPAASSPATKDREEKRREGKKEDKEKGLFQRVNEESGPGVCKSGGPLSSALGNWML
jgi:hypothetical protein